MRISGRYSNSHPEHLGPATISSTCEEVMGVPVDDAFEDPSADCSDAAFTREQGK